MKGEVDMSVSEWTEGLKKKEASLIYVHPSVTACAVPAPSAGSLLAFLTNSYTVLAGRQ